MNLVTKEDIYYILREEGVTSFINDECIIIIQNIINPLFNDLFTFDNLNQFNVKLNSLLDKLCLDDFKKTTEYINKILAQNQNLRASYKFIYELVLGYLLRFVYLKGFDQNPTANTPFLIYKAFAEENTHALNIFYKYKNVLPQECFYDKWYHQTCRRQNQFIDVREPINTTFSDLLNSAGYLSYFDNETLLFLNTTFNEFNMLFTEGDQYDEIALKLINAVKEIENNRNNNNNSQEQNIKNNRDRSRSPVRQFRSDKVTEVPYFENSIEASKFFYEHYFKLFIQQLKNNNLSIPIKFTEAMDAIINNQYIKFLDYS